MLLRPQILAYLELNLSPYRLAHSHQVAALAQALALQYGWNAEKAWLAGICHDLAREWSKKDAESYCHEHHLEALELEKQHPILLHSLIASHFVSNQWKISDPEICQAIRWHSLGHAKMSLSEKILFVADFSSLDRDFKEASDVRIMAFQNLDQAVRFKQNFKIKL